MNELLSTTPQTQTDFRQWVRDSITVLLPLAESENSELPRQVALLIRRAKLHAVTLGLTSVASGLPETLSKTPLDGLCRLQEISGLPNAVPEFLTIQEVSAYTGLSISSIRRRAADGTLPEPTKFGRLIKWKRIEIEAL